MAEGLVMLEEGWMSSVCVCVSLDIEGVLALGGTISKEYVSWKGMSSYEPHIDQDMISYAVACLYLSLSTF